MHAGLDDLMAFAAVAEARSFRRAAAGLGVSTSALSHTLKRLETRLGVRLLQRNSRSVAPSEAGERLLRTLSPALADIGGALDQLGRARGEVAGTVRITATRQAYEAVIRPVLAVFLERHPRAAVEVLIEYEFRDIIAGRFDAGIRIGEKLEGDMIALAVSPPLRMAVIASPLYLAAHAPPKTPPDLNDHRCIGYRMRADGSDIAWEFKRDDREVEVRPAAAVTVNEPEIALDAALDGLGLAYVLEDRAAPFLADGRLVRLLDDWSPQFPGFFLYHPSRRQMRPVLAALIAILREWRTAS